MYEFCLTTLFKLGTIKNFLRTTSYWGCLTRASGDIAGSNDNTADGDTIDNGTDTATLRAAFATTPPTDLCGTTVDNTAAYYTDATSTIVYSINNAVLRKNTNDQNNDLIEGVENMQILYGEDTDDDDSWPNYYVEAYNVFNWENVVTTNINRR